MANIFCAPLPTERERERETKEKEQRETSFFGDTERD